jgi:hypothetical protein
MPPEYWDRLRERLVQAGRWDDPFLGEKGPDYPFALGFVESSVSLEFLYRQYQEAQDGIDSGYCLGTGEQDGRCLGCGACVGDEQRRAITRHQVRQPRRAPYFSHLRQVVARKRKLRPAYFRVRVDPALAGILPECLNAFAFKHILTRYPELADNLLSVRESLFTLRPNASQFPFVTGETVFGLKVWDLEPLETGFCRFAYAENPVSGSHLVQIIGPAERFEPGIFTRMHLDVHLPADLFPEPRVRLEQYLRGAYLRYSLRREGSRYRFDLPPKALKKKILFGGSFEAREDGFFASLDVGQKFDLAAFLERFGRRNLAHHARVQVSGVDW